MSPAEITASVERTKRIGRLDWNERQMSTAAKSIASSLKEIHDQKLWQDAYVSFEAYCKTKWGISRQRAYQMIGAENVRMMLADSPDAEVAAAAPTLNDGQATELATVEPERRAEVYKEATKIDAKAPARAIKQAKARVIDAATGKPEQQEFSFTFKTAPEHRDDAAWFVSLTEQQRHEIITNARKTTT